MTIWSAEKRGCNGKTFVQVDCVHQADLNNMKKQPLSVNTFFYLWYSPG
jgi:hypothetical protein